MTFFNAPSFGDVRVRMVHRSECGASAALRRGARLNRAAVVADSGVAGTLEPRRAGAALRFGEVAAIAGPLLADEAGTLVVLGEIARATIAVRTGVLRLPRAPAAVATLAA